MILSDQEKAIQWARNVLTNKEEYALLDTETTGLGDAEMCEIAIIDLDGKPLLDTLVKPTIAIPREAIDIHGISNEDVKNAPSFKDIYTNLSDIFKDRKIIIYNKSFDTRIIEHCCTVHELDRLDINAECLMLRYAVFYGAWNDYHESYTGQPLQGGGHRALSDCMAALNYLQEMAEG